MVHKKGGATAASNVGLVGNRGFGNRSDNHSANRIDYQIGFIEMNPVFAIVSE